jgi:hypothetical protein
LDLAPKETRYSYVYAVALQSAGREREAVTTIEAALKRAPGDRALNELREQLSKANDAGRKARLGEK